MLLKRFSSASSARPKDFSRFEREAEDITRDPERVRDVVRDAFAKLSKHRKEVGRIGAELPLLLRLVRAWVGGEYRRIPLKAIVMIVAAALYFLNPLDLIPDFLPVIGYLDDAAVVGYVLRTLRKELDVFRAWEEEKLLTS